MVLIRPPGAGETSETSHRLICYTTLRKASFQAKSMKRKSPNLSILDLDSTRVVDFALHILQQRQVQLVEWRAPLYGRMQAPMMGRVRTKLAGNGSIGFEFLIYRSTPMPYPIMTSSGHLRPCQTSDYLCQHRPTCSYKLWEIFGQKPITTGSPTQDPTYWANILLSILFLLQPSRFLN